MQLLHSPASPFARKVRVTAIEAGLDDQIELVAVKTAPVATAPELARANPVGKIPTLLRDDGPAIFDSRVICRYLAARSGTGLYPEARIWEVLTLEALGDGIMDAAVLLIYEARFNEGASRNEGWLAGQRDRITRSLDALEDPWQSQLAGKITAGQIAVGCALGYLDFRHGDLGWRTTRPALSAWEARFAERPSMKATLPRD